MPEWGDKPDVALAAALTTVLEGLKDEVADNPSFGQVTGVPQDAMMRHASDSIATVFGKRRGTDLDELTQCYAMGFVVGMKFAEYQRLHARDDT